MSQQQRISESPASQGSEEIETDTKCVLTVNQFSKHSLSCDSKRLSALVFGSFQPRHVPLLKLMVCCVNDTRNEVENVKFKAKESFLMEMLALEKKFEILTCEYSDSEDKESYDVSLLLDGFETGWMMQNDCPKKVIKYVKLLKNEAEYATYALSPKMADAPDVFVCKIHIKQKVSEDQEEDIKLLTSTEFDIHWKLPVAPHMDLNNLGSYSGGPTCLRSAPQRSSHPLPGREVQRHGGNHFQLRPNQQYYQQDPYLQNQPRIQSDNGSQQDDFQSQTAREMVVPGQYQQNQPSLQPNLRNQWLQQGNFQSQTLPGESTGPNISYHQQGESQHSRLPQEPVTDHHLEEQGGDHFQTRRKSGHDFPSLPPQQDPVAAEDQDQGVTDPQTIKTMGNQALNQAHGDNQLERLPTSVPHEIAGVLGQIPSNTDNKQFTLLYQVNHNYFSEKASVTHMKENDVTTSFHKHIPPRVKKRLNETLCQSDVWDQVKKMYGIPDETPCPHDVVASLLSHVEGSIASFISVLLKLKERHREGQKEIPQNLIDEVKDGLQSEMEYKKLRQNKIRFAEELYIDIGRILDYFNQDDMVRDEEITVLKNTAKENPRDACRKLFERLIASSPEKQPIKCLKDALRQCQYWHLGDELEVSKQDVEDELQKHEVGGDRPSCEEPLAIGI
ncbi:uncharacterized protein LOC106181096 [Lingula anatina]|uniref:Uncharacterized protein LOC106181096 n=1 Tax=Lingula anatina TaxID=7574 RepID=A0A1S3KF04_LINAN|nr:uncharacterized protein LOC106181096 [Lingula anatina]|eukprot:XP_013420826.1 uncharacterized protein LOC106181096 [Lingula anatina]